MYSKAFFFQGNLFINTFKKTFLKYYEQFGYFYGTCIFLHRIFMRLFLCHWLPKRHFYNVSIWNQGQTIQWNVGITNIFQNQIKNSKEKYRCKANTDLHKNQSQVRCRSKQPLVTVYTRYVLFVVFGKREIIDNQGTNNGLKLSMKNVGQHST